jgi:hypothetical protein
MLTPCVFFPINENECSLISSFVLLLKYAPIALIASGEGASALMNRFCSSTPFGDAVKNLFILSC